MKHKIKIILADDDPVWRQILPRQLDAREFDVGTVKTGAELLEALRASDYEIVLLDLGLPGMSGLEVLKQIRTLADPPEVIVLTADNSLESGLEAMRLGAYEYLTKPADAKHLEIVIRKAEEKNFLVRQNARLRAVVRRQTENGQPIDPVIESAVMKQILAQAERVAPIDTTILITGESGTGKDVLARWIHDQSPRRDVPLISINCGALPESLFESEFFGHEKGSFTGATGQKIGLIEAGDGGTLFLDEIGEMPLTMQVKLLHFLENGIFRRIGSTRDRKADVRVIAATNRPLEADVREAKFRADLFYRLNVVSFHLPPLRERRADIPPLIDFFVARLQHKFNRPNLSLSNAARQKLERHEWRGNIRELRNALERAVVLSAADEIDDVEGLNSHVNLTAPVASSAPPNVYTVSEDAALLPLFEIEKQHILHVLSAVGGKRERAAALLGITSRTLYRKLNEYGAKV